MADLGGANAPPFFLAEALSRAASERYSLINSTKILDPNGVGASRREARPGPPEGKFVQNCLPSADGLLCPRTVDRDCLRAVPLPPVDNTRVIDYNYKCG